METEPTCYKCGSQNCRCWDERIHTYLDTQTDETFEMPVGYMVCNDCRTSWLEIEEAVKEPHIQDITEDLYGYD